VAAVARLLEQRPPDLPLRIAFLIEGEEWAAKSFPGFLAIPANTLAANFIFLFGHRNPESGSGGDYMWAARTGAV
jgi:hypothetical protein